MTEICRPVAGWAGVPPLPWACLMPFTLLRREGQQTSARQRKYRNRTKLAARKNVGLQDQVATNFGGLNHITSPANGEIAVRPVTSATERMKELNSHLMLIYTGIARTSSMIAESYVNDDSKKRQFEYSRILSTRALPCSMATEALRPLESFSMRPGSRHVV
jgi:galactokinase/mevalonate kinase-like predicted kinase